MDAIEQAIVELINKLVRIKQVELEKDIRARRQAHAEFLARLKPSVDRLYNTVGADATNYAEFLPPQGEGAPNLNAPQQGQLPPRRTANGGQHGEARAG